MAYARAAAQPPSATFDTRLRPTVRLNFMAAASKVLSRDFVARFEDLDKISQILYSSQDALSLPRRRFINIIRNWLVSIINGPYIFSIINGPYRLYRHNQGCNCSTRSFLDTHSTEQDTSEDVYPRWQDVARLGHHTTCALTSRPVLVFDWPPSDGRVSLCEYNFTQCPPYWREAWRTQTSRIFSYPDLHIPDDFDFLDDQWLSPCFDSFTGFEIPGAGRHPSSEVPSSEKCAFRNGGKIHGDWNPFRVNGGSGLSLLESLITTFERQVSDCALHCTSWGA